MPDITTHLETNEAFNGASSRALPIVGLHLPPAAITNVLMRHSRQEIEGFISVAIELLDLADSDPDTEEDDPAGVCDEDGINTEHFSSLGPGCIISDCDNEHDGCEPEDNF